MKFKNDIELQAGLEDLSGSTGTSGQLLSSTGTGTSWIAQDDIISAASKLVVIACKNTHSATISKGTPVYQTGTVGATDVIEIAPADALISLGHQPAIGLLQQDLAINEFGNVVITGELLNFTTDPIDGLTPVTGQKVFLKSGGGLTLTKPTGVTNGIQNLGLIGKVSGGNSGSITVSSIMRTNDVPNLTTGKIWVGDGNTVESTVVHLDEVNGRMGIGTTSPTESLSVFGRLLITTNQGALDNGYFTKITSNYSANPFILESRLGVLMQAEDYGNSLSLHSGNAERVRINGANGNVGIGTTSPSARLEVSDGNTTKTAIHIDNTSTGGNRWDIASIGSGVSGRVGNLQIRNDSDTLNIVEITAAGNVGIGTTSPTTTLDIRKSLGTGLISDTNSTLRLVDTSTGLNAGQGGAISLSGVYNSAGAILGGSPYIRAAKANANDGDYGFGLGFGVRLNGSATPTTEMVIDQSGNVGIGTTSPVLKLHLIGTNSLPATSGTTQNGGIRIENGVNSGVLDIGASNATGAPGWIQSTDKADLSQTYNLLLNPNGGNVGIGTTSPTDKLYIKGDNPNIVLYSDTLTGSLINFIDQTYQSQIMGSQGTLVFNTGGTSERMRITLDGNVGIGTTSPGHKLDVYTNTDNGYVASFSQDNATGWGVLIDTDGVSNNDPALWVKNATSTVLWAAQSGNVGIGTASPSQKLDVVGNIELNGALYISNSGIYQQSNSDVSGLELVANVSLSFYRAAFFDYVIQKEGNVRAGTVFACNDGGSVEYTETSTNDIGDTSDVVLSVDISAGNMRLLADAATSGWSVKSLIRAI